MAERDDAASSGPPARRSATLDQPALEAWGRRVGESAVAGDLPLPLTLVLRGSLGAGKSVLARAVARGAGVTSPMPSPTYNLLFSYDAGLREPAAGGSDGDSAGQGADPTGRSADHAAGGSGGESAVRVHHLDLYRLEDPEDVWELGWEELGEGEELVLIEWPERAESLLPPDRWEVHLGFPGESGSAPESASEPGSGPGSGAGSGSGVGAGAGGTPYRTIRLWPEGDVPEPPPLPDSSPGAGSGRRGGESS